MGSLFLSRQKYEDRQILVRDLHNTQKGNCFICEEPIDLVVQKNSIDIDHVIPLKDTCQL
jgi:CRISPR/Cas system Type II protein with McrA/HNH and RuvC-like nuclease domain